MQMQVLPYPCVPFPHNHSGKRAEVARGDHTSASECFGIGIRCHVARGPEHERGNIPDSVGRLSARFSLQKHPLRSRACRKHVEEFPGNTKHDE